MCPRFCPLIFALLSHRFALGRGEEKGNGEQISTLGRSANEFIFGLLIRRRLMFYCISQGRVCGKKEPSGGCGSGEKKAFTQEITQRLVVSRFRVSLQPPLWFRNVHLNIRGLSERL